MHIPFGLFKIFYMEIVNIIIFEHCHQQVNVWAYLDRKEQGDYICTSNASFADP